MRQLSHINADYQCCVTRKQRITSRVDASVIIQEPKAFSRRERGNETKVFSFMVEPDNQGTLLGLSAVFCGKRAFHQSILYI